MWRSVFLHEFPDSNIRNFQALAGSPTPASLSLTPAPSPPLQGRKAVAIAPGRGFKYILKQPLDQVIGISGRVRIRVPFPGGSDNPIPIMQLGDNVEFRILQKPLVVHDEPLAMHQGLVVTAPNATALLRIGPTEIALGTVNLLPMPPFWFSELRFDWHTSGQARLFHNRRLVGYHNAVAPGIHFDVTNVVFGIPDATAATDPGYSIGRVFVRVLRRPDPLLDFSKLLPKVPFPEGVPYELCQLLPIANLLAMTDRMRQFMSLIHQNLSQPWSAAAGPDEGPFKAEALAAHEHAMRAVIELAKMLRSADFSNPNAFLDPFEAFLRILHDAQPGEFTALAVEMSNIPVVPEECAPIVQKLLEENEQSLGPIFDVFTKAHDRIKEIAGGF